jgi:IclR family pca regulon transcriptional regulator
MISRHPAPLKPLPDLDGYAGDPNFVLSLARGLRVIEGFESRTSGMTIAEVATAAEISRASARRLLLTLQTLDYVECSRRIYRLKTRTLKLGFSYLSSTSIVAAAQPILERITETLHESASMSVLDGDQIIYVARSVASRVMSVGLSVGSRLPAYCTSMGRVLLGAHSDAELDDYLRNLRPERHTSKTTVGKILLRRAIAQARADGYSIVDGELEIGLRALAVPVRGRNGRIAAAINVGVHALRVERKDMLRRFLPVLTQQAAALSLLLI